MFQLIPGYTLRQKHRIGIGIGWIEARGTKDVDCPYVQGSSIAIASRNECGRRRAVFYQEFLGHHEAKKHLKAQARSSVATDVRSRPLYILQANPFRRFD